MKTSILLSGGMGSRISKVTRYIPKPAIPISGYPLLHIWFNYLDSIGIDQVFVNGCYKKEIIKNLCETWQGRLTVRFVAEAHLLGTMGSVENIVRNYELESDVYVLHADNLIRNPRSLDPFFEFSSGSPITACCFHVSETEKFGVYELSDDDEVIGFMEKSCNAVGCWANAAIYKFNPDIVKKFSGATCISNDVLAVATGITSVFKSDIQLIDIGTPENFLMLVKEGKITNDFSKDDRCLQLNSDSQAAYARYDQNLPHIIKEWLNENLRAR